MTKAAFATSVGEMDAFPNATGTKCYLHNSQPLVFNPQEQNSLDLLYRGVLPPNLRIPRKSIINTQDRNLVSCPSRWWGIKKSTVADERTDSRNNANKLDCAHMVYFKVCHGRDGNWFVKTGIKPK